MWVGAAIYKYEHLRVWPEYRRSDGHCVRQFRESEHVVESARGAVPLPDLVLQPEHCALCQVSEREPAAVREHLQRPVRVRSRLVARLEPRRRRQPKLQMRPAFRTRGSFYDPLICTLNRVILLACAIL